MYRNSSVMAKNNRSWYLMIRKYLKNSLIANPPSGRLTSFIEMNLPKYQNTETDRSLPKTTGDGTVCREKFFKIISGQTPLQDG